MAHGEKWLGLLPLKFIGSIPGTVLNLLKEVIEGVNGCLCMCPCEGLEIWLGLAPAPPQPWNKINCQKWMDKESHLGENRPLQPLHMSNTMGTNSAPIVPWRCVESCYVLMT